MDEDFAVPKALAVIHGAVRKGNTALAEGDREQASALAQSVRAMAAVLGVDPLAETWHSEQDNSAAMGALDALVEAQLVRRAQARANKDWAVADEVRDTLAAAGVEVIDTADGAQWQLKAGK